MPQQTLAAKTAQNNMWMYPWREHSKLLQNMAFFFLAKRYVIFILGMSRQAETKKQHN